MSSAPDQVSLAEIMDIAEAARKRGIRLRTEAGRLRYVAPKGALTSEFIATLRQFSGPMVAYLESMPEQERSCVPLTESQLAYWHAFRLAERNAVRHVASETRLRGRLNVDALRTAITEVVRRHDALRTQIVIRDGLPVQMIHAAANCEMEWVDLIDVPEPLRAEQVAQHAAQLVLQTVDLAVDPLLGLKLMRLGDDEHLLVMALAHIISDAFSMQILLRDIFTAYAGVVKNRVLSLPPIGMQFSEYALKQRARQRPLTDEDIGHHARLVACGRLKFPCDETLREPTGTGWGVVRISVGADVKERLARWCRQRHTTVALSAFTAYVASVLRWCDTSRAVIRYISDGRADPKVQNTVGFFASALYPCLEILETDTFIELLNRVTREYCVAYERVDVFDRLCQDGAPEFTNNTFFNWVPQQSRISLPELDGSKEAIVCSPVPLTRPAVSALELDRDPGILVFDSHEALGCEVHFPLDRFCAETMQRFGDNFIRFLETMIEDPGRRIKQVQLLR